MCWLSLWPVYLQVARSCNIELMLKPFTASRNMIWTAGIHMVDEMGAPAALVGSYDLCDQSDGHGFDW